MDLSLGTYLALIVLAAAGGAALPLLGRWSQRQLHLFVAFGAGVFLGAIFFHLLPESLAQGDDRSAQFSILAGFLLVLVVDRVAVPRGEAGAESPGERSDMGRHRAIGFTAMVGLSLHSFTAGVALGLGHTNPQISLVIFLAIISHKAVAAFSLATVFKLSNQALRRSLVLLALFAASTPLGALMALPLVPSLSQWQPAVPLALATGTFMYVATVNLLPEAFHQPYRRAGTFAALGLGILMMAVISRFGG